MCFQLFPESKAIIARFGCLEYDICHKLLHNSDRSVSKVFLTF